MKIINLRYQYLNPILVVFIGNVSQWISMLKFSTKKAKEKKIKPKRQSISYGNSKSKNKLLRSLSSVFKQGDEGNSMSDSIADEEEENSEIGSFLMPNETKSTLVLSKKKSRQSKSTIFGRNKFI